MSPIERPEGLTAQVYKEMERMVLEGELKPGERLNEYALSVRLGVSRGPVREARRALEKAGLLHSVPARGVFVRKMSPREIVENYEIRALLTGFLCGRAAERAKTGDKRRLWTMLAAMEDAVARGEIDEYYGVNLEFHALINRLADHDYARSTYEAVIKETHHCRTSVIDPVVTNSQHRQLLEAFEAKDAAAARHLGETHVLAGKDRWVQAESAALREAERAS